MKLCDSINSFANSSSSYGGASLAAVPSEAMTDKIMRSRFSSAAKGALEKERSPAAMSDEGQKNYNLQWWTKGHFAGKKERRL